MANLQLCWQSLRHQQACIHGCAVVPPTLRDPSMRLPASETLLVVHVRGVDFPRSQLCTVTRYALCSRHTSATRLSQACGTDPSCTSRAVKTMSMHQPQLRQLAQIWVSCRTTWLYTARLHIFPIFLKTLTSTLKNKERKKERKNERK